MTVTLTVTEAQINQLDLSAVQEIVARELAPEKLTNSPNLRLIIDYPRAQEDRVD
jgi:hypothetical protein